MRNPKKMVYKPSERTIVIQSVVTRATEVSRGVLGRYSQAAKVSEAHTFLETDIVVSSELGRKTVSDGYEALLIVSAPKWVNLHFINGDSEITIAVKGLYQTVGAFKGSIEISTDEPDNELIRCTIIKA